jgi:hypothetical protein
MEEFAQLAQMTLNDPKGKGSPYRIRITEFRQHNRSHEVVQVKLNNLLSTLFQHARIGFPGGVHSRVDNAAGQWAARVLLDEFQKLHNNTSHVGQTIPSVLLEYGRRIQSVSRLVKTAD